MALPTVDINLLNGGSGRTAPGFDYYSGLMLYGTAPTVTGKWATYKGDPDIKAQQMFSEADATSAGILPYTDNTAATGTYVISNAGNTNDTVEMKITVPLANGGTQVVSLGVYTISASETTIAQQGAAWAAIINAGTVNHGYSASFTTATLTITAPKTAGVSLNSGTPIAVTITGGNLTGSITQFTNGTASQHAVWYYHISEYFRINPTGNLWVGIISASDDFKEVKTLQLASNSKIKWLGVYDIDTTRASAANITGSILQLDTAVKLTEKSAPYYACIYTPNIKNISDLSTYPDQNTNTANKVCCLISQDGDNDGALLYVRNGQSVGNVGAALGAASKGRVSGSFAWATADFNMSDGDENNLPAFANGQLNSVVTENLQSQLHSYNYTFFRQFGDTVVGTFFVDNRCCVNNSSDYAYIDDNAVAAKISRICYATYIPLLNSELIFNSDGTLKDYTVEYFKDTGDDAIRGEMMTGYGALPLISDFEISIDPTQPVKQTNNLVIVVKVVKNGIARKITINIGYALSL